MRTIVEKRIMNGGIQYSQIKSPIYAKEVVSDVVNKSTEASGEHIDNRLHYRQ